MTPYSTSLVILLTIIHNDMGAEISNCPPNQIKFHKLIGLRPAAPPNDRPLYKGNIGVPVTLECIQSCVQDKTCQSFILSYNNSECYSYDQLESNLKNYDYDSKPDSNVVWFKKTCSNIDTECKKAWTFEVVSGADFIGQDKKTVGNLTREECIDHCVTEDLFVCRSIRFYNSDTSNVNSIGLCTLSDSDRHLVPSSFRVSRYENEYIENQCVDTTTIDFCTYEEYENVTLKHADVKLTNINDNNCRQECNTLSTFNCRGYSVMARRNIKTNAVERRCILHSEDTKLIGPKLLENSPGGRYYERVRCLNVSAFCTDEFMTIKYAPEQKFTGQIYTEGYSDNTVCSAEGHGNEEIVLEIPLGHNDCGLVETQSMTNPKRTVKSVLLVIQYNKYIQTQADRYIRIGCAEGEESEITVGTNINFTNTHPNKGSTIINNSTVLPTVTIRIVDYETKLPVKDTEIGQELQLIIEIKPANGPYDIWAGHLVATSDNGQDSILLLDDNGCPTQEHIFQKFTKVVTNDSRMLVSTFQAFKFTSSPVVRFSVMVHFCTLSCPDTYCPNNKKKKRNADYIENVATITPLNKTNSTYIEVMPLNFLLIVRGSSVKPEELVLGESKILIADKEWFINQVCVDYALFVGLAVLWIILQIIILVCCFLLIRKYKKYFDIAYTRQLDEQQFSETHQRFGLGGEHLSRKVRWADQ